MTAASPRSSPEHVPVVILGAGLTGLAAAEALGRANVPHRVFERESHAGGHAITLEESGYRFDRTGHLLHVRSQELRSEVAAWLEGDYVELERRSVVFSHGVFTRYPFQANTAGLPPQVAYDCLLGFLRARYESPPTAPHNFEEYCLAHFGSGFAEHFFLPYNQKLWGVAPREITADWCQRFVPLPQLEDVLKGALGLADPGLGYNARFLYPRHGIGALARALERRVPAITFDSAPLAIDPQTRSVRFHDFTLRYDVLINTMPLPALIDLLSESPQSLRDARRALRATDLFYLDLALNCPARRDFHWAYVPEPRLPFYRVGCYTNFSAALAPPGCSSLYVELAQRQEAPLEQLLPPVLAGLYEMGLLKSASDLAFARLRRLSPAYVIYDHAHTSALSQIEPFLREAGIVSTGRYGGWNYSSMEDALLFGREAARRASAELRP